MTYFSNIDLFEIHTNWLIQTIQKNREPEVYFDIKTKWHDWNSHSVLTVFTYNGFVFQNVYTGIRINWLWNTLHIYSKHIPTLHNPLINLYCEYQVILLIGSNFDQTVFTSFSRRPTSKIAADWNVLFAKLWWAYLANVFYEHTAR